MPKEGQPCHYAHQVDENNSRELYVAFTLGNSRIKFDEQVHDAELFEEVKELVEEPGFAKAIDL